MVLKAPNPWNAAQADLNDIVESFADFPHGYALSELVGGLVLENTIETGETQLWH